MRRIIFSLISIYIIIIVSSCSKNSTEPQQQNQTPQITSIVPNPYSIPMQGIITLTCLAADPDGDQLNYVWEAAVGTINGTGPSVEWTAPGTEGMYQISCKVSDGKGGEAAQSVDVEVSGSFNQPPQISSVTVNADSVILTEFATFICNATDGDGDVLNYEWQATGGTIQANGNMADWTAPDTVGFYDITVIVTDGRGGQDSRTTSLKAVQAPIPTQGLLAFYPFEGNSRDESGNNYDGILMGSSQMLDGTLEIGDNATERIYLPNNMVDGLTDFTFAAWLKIDVVHVGNLNTALSGASSATHNAFSFWYSRETTSGGIYDKTWRIVLAGTGYSFARNDVIEDLTWHHVAVKRDGAFAYLYIDGLQIGGPVGVTPASVSVASGGLFLGQEQDAIGGSFSAAQSWAGEMDNVRFYNRPLSEDEIRALFDESHSD